MVIPRYDDVHPYIPTITTITTDSELTIPGFRERAQDAQSSVNVKCSEGLSLNTDPGTIKANPYTAPMLCGPSSRSSGEIQAAGLQVSRYIILVVPTRKAFRSRKRAADSSVALLNHSKVHRSTSS